jgi:hypothetical protein
MPKKRRQWASRWSDPTTDDPLHSADQAAPLQPSLNPSPPRSPGRWRGCRIASQETRAERPRTSLPPPPPRPARRKRAAAKHLPGSPTTTAGRRREGFEACTRSGLVYYQRQRISTPSTPTSIGVEEEAEETLGGSNLWPSIHKL